MMKAHRRGGQPAGTANLLSMDLRERVLVCIGSGVSGRQAAERFDVGAARVSHRRTREREQGEVEPPEFRAMIASLARLMTQPNFKAAHLHQATYHARPSRWSPSNVIRIGLVGGAVEICVECGSDSAEQEAVLLPHADEAAFDIHDPVLGEHLQAFS